LKLKHSISEKITLNRERVWLFEFTQDITQRQIWDKQTLEIGFLEGDAVLQKGARVYTKSREGIRMDTEYLTFETPIEISIRMMNHSSIFKDFIGTWKYHPTASNTTTLEITYEFNLRFPYRIFSSIVSKKVRKNVLQKLHFLESHLSKMEIAAK